MKKIVILILLIGSVLNLKAQVKDEICGTKITGKPIIFTEKQNDSLKSVMVVNQPYAIKIWVTVFANDDGSNRAATDANIYRQLQNMSNQFQPQNICFVLMGLTQVNNSDLNDHIASTEEAELNPFRVAGCLNIFIHQQLPGLFGIAYAIPNSYLSMRSDAMASTTMISILAHEMGHCLGLIHTFETYGMPKDENVARSGNCSNCSTRGDLLCDTPADDNGGENGSCVYNGTGVDACNVAYSTNPPLTNNVMSYYNFCSNTFTNGQGNRMRSFLLTNSTLNSFLVNDVLYMPSSANSSITWTFGSQTYAARDNIYICFYANNIYNVSGSANQNIVSRKVTLKPGTRFSPSTGRVKITANPYCQ